MEIFWNDYSIWCMKMFFVPPRTNKGLNRNNQSGIAIAPILFIIAVLAILAAVLAATSSGFLSNTANDEYKVVAQQIIGFGNSVAFAMTKMSADYSIDPETGVWNAGTQYSCINYCQNGDQASCTIFNDSGFGSTANAIPDIWIPLKYLTPPYNGGAAIYSANSDRGLIVTLSMSGVGNPAKGQIALEIQGLNSTLCKEINRQLGLGSIIPGPDGGGNVQGYGCSGATPEPADGTTPLGSVATQLAGQQQFCYSNGNFGNSEYDYIQIIIVR